MKYLQFTKALSLSMLELKNYLYAEHENSTVYFDRDSEDEGVLLPEVAYIRLAASIDWGDLNSAKDSALSELYWLIQLNSDLTYSGKGFTFESEEEGYEHFWKLAKRLACILNENKDVENVAQLTFRELINIYGFSVEEN